MPGERRHFAIHAGYGQSLRVRADFPVIVEDPGYGVISALNPLRETLRFADTGDVSAVTGRVQFSTPRAGDTVAGHLSRGFAPANRLASNSRDQPYAIPGIQYVVVSRMGQPDSVGVELPYQLTVEVVGGLVEGGYEAVRTAEQYQDAFGEAEPVDVASEEPSPQESPEPSDQPSGEPSDEPTIEQPIEDGIGGWVYVLGGLGAVLIVSGAVWMLLRRRSLV